MSTHLRQNSRELSVCPSTKDLHAHRAGNIGATIRLIDEDTTVGDVGCFHDVAFGRDYEIEVGAPFVTSCASSIPSLVPGTSISVSSASTPGGPQGPTKPHGVSSLQDPKAKSVQEVGAVKSKPSVIFNEKARR